MFTKKSCAMKTISSFIFSIICLFSLYSCQEESFTDHSLDNYFRNEPARLEFTSVFSTSATSSEDYTEGSGSSLWLNNVQSGTGNAPCLGAFTFCMNCLFCCEGENCGRYESNGCFTSESGDKIFIAFSGKATVYNATDHSGYAGRFEDDFKVTGGTGSFENAAGEGVFKSCFTCKLARIDHVITARIWLPRREEIKPDISSVHLF